MTAMLFIALCIVGGILIAVMVVINGNLDVNSKLAEELLRGGMQHEGKNLMQALQRADKDVVKFFTPLKHFCNAVCVYMRLGGKFPTLNAKLETIRSTLASHERPIPEVKFSYREGTDHHAIVEIGHSGCKYLFDLHHMDSLDLLKRGSDMK